MDMKSSAWSLFALTLFVAVTQAQNQRDVAVRTDKQELSSDSSWIYDDLGAAFAEATRTKRPLMVVLR